MIARYEVVGALDRSAAEQIEGAASTISDDMILVDDGDEEVLIAQPVVTMSSTETYTRLDIDERRELLERVESIEAGTRVRLSYDSARSSDDQTVEAYAVDYGDKPLYARTDDLKGDVYVDVWNIESKHHAGLVVKTTGGRHTSRQPRLGELLDVEVIDDD